MNFSKAINNVSVKDKNVTFTIPTPSGTNITGTINLKTIANGIQEIGGSAGTGSFTMSVDAFGNVTGLYTSVKDRKAFRYYTDEVSGNVIVKEVDIATVLCIDFKKAPEPSVNNASNSNERGITAIPIYNSKPGSQYVIYIDLDGETSTSSWNSGTTINAAARAWTNAEVLLMWQTASQDYITWDVNVTTDRAVFDAAASCKRKMAIVTSTTTAAPGSGGVAYIDTFDDCSGDPCWVFNSGAKTAGETVAHEVGHTVGLHHDGTPSATYYSGHPSSSPVWAPIMGSSYGTNVVGQWSIGEYTNANMQEDDINIIGTHNGFAPKPDDVGGTISTAGNLAVESNGTSVLNTLNRGIINNRTDLDLWKLTTVSTGNLSLTIAPASVNPDLNVQARLLNSSGTAIATANPAGTTYASMSATLTSNSLPAGVYYIEIDGVGNGADPTVGYSDYASIGDYYISGTVPAASNKPIPQFSASVSTLCAGSQVAFTDQSLNTITSWKWTFAGGTPATSTTQSPTITYNSAGTYDVKLVVKNANGTDSLTKAASIVVNAIPAAPVTTGAGRCNAGIVPGLKATGGGGSYQWFTTPTGTTITNTGGTYNPNVSVTTTYYVSETLNGCTGPRSPVTATITPTPATPTITQNGSVLTSSAPTGNQWYRNGTLIPGATGQNYTVTQNGTYTVKVTINNCASALSAQFNVTNTGIDQTTNAYLFTIYPNPNDGNFNVSFNTDTKATYKLELRNTLGQLIYQETLTDFTGSYSKQLNVEEFGNGIYMISLTNEKSETIKKVIVY
jgi:PKD repeat protein